MPVRFFPLIPSIILVFGLVGCVSKPDHVELIDVDLDRGMLQVKAGCILGQQYSSADVSQQSHALDSRNISVLNWNVYKGKRDNWADDFELLLQKKDIVILQEALFDESFQEPLSKKGFNWSLNHSFTYNDAENGVLTASTAKAKRVCGLRETEPLIQTPKTVLISEYNLSGTAQTLLVANIHGINFTLGTEVYERQIKALSNSIKDHKGPVIVAGDFNTWSDDRMDIVANVARQLSLEAISYKNHNRITVFGNPLDHVFYRGLEVIHENSIEVTSSDHNPIVVTFRLPPRLIESARI